MIILGALFWTTTGGSAPPPPATPTPGGDPWKNSLRAEEDGIILQAIEGFLKGDRWRTRH